MDAPSFPKRFQAKVGGEMWVGSTPLSLARDTDVALARVFDLLAHLGPLGKGRTARDDKERQATPVTLSTGVGVHDATPRPQHHRG